MLGQVARPPDHLAAHLADGSRDGDLIRTSIPEEYDFPQGIGAFPSGIRLTAPIP